MTLQLSGLFFLDLFQLVKNVEVVDQFFTTRYFKAASSSCYYGIKEQQLGFWPAQSLQQKVPPIRPW